MALVLNKHEVEQLLSMEEAIAVTRAMHQEHCPVKTGD